MKSFLATIGAEPTGAADWDFGVDGLGVDGVIAHWDADTLTPPPSSFVGAWRAATTKHTLEGSAAQVQVDGEHQYARFDGVDDYVSLPVTGLGVKTVAVLVRHANLSPGSYISLGGTYARYNGSGYSLVGGTTQYPSISRAGNLWNLVFLSMDGAARTFAQNDGSATTGSGASVGITKIELGRNISGGDYGGQPMWIGKIVAYDHVLSASERTSAWGAVNASRPVWTD